MTYGPYADPFMASLFNDSTISKFRYEDDLRQLTLKALRKQIDEPSPGYLQQQRDKERQKLLKQLLATMKSDREKANAANQKRYDEAKGIFEQNIASLANIGAQRQADIARDFQGLASRQQSDLVARGLGGTTIAPTLAMGLERERTGALTRAANETTMLQNQARQDLAGLIERREDVAPDYTAALIQLLAQI